MVLVERDGKQEDRWWLRVFFRGSGPGRKTDDGCRVESAADGDAVLHLPHARSVEAESATVADVPCAGM